MNSIELADFAGRLRHELGDIEAQIDSYEFIRRESLQDSTHELSKYDNHPADLGNETFEREKDLALLDNARLLREKVESALARIDEGTYGICTACGAEIDRDRLEALPYVDLCLDCQQKSEAWDPPRWRPIEEELLYPPFGRTFLDGTTNVGVDGEDTWQQVARVGTSNSPSDVGGTDSYEELYIDHDERHGLVEEVDAIIDTEDGEIPPDPHEVEDTSK